MGSLKRTGVVLAGGYSTRFGEQEKALAKLDGQPLLAHAVKGVAPVVDGVLVNCRRDQLPMFRNVLTSISTDIAFVCDPKPGAGPAAGLRTALETVDTSRVAVVACDMPFVDAAFLDWLFGVMNDADGAVPYVDGVPQPTHAVYATKPTRRAAEDAVTNASGSLRDVLARLDTVDVSESRVLENTSRTSFVNVNSPTELDTVATDHGSEANE
jgi:molybdopterin-guanine dinucleotide biosynthesis protein A